MNSADILLIMEYAWIDKTQISHLKNIDYWVSIFESIHYIGDNLMDRFPPDCRYFGDNNIKPVNVCYICTNKNCNRNAQYIEAILSDGVEYNLDDILKDVAIGKITDNEALDLINRELYRRNTPIKLQILLRQDALDKNYFTFIDSYAIDEDECKLLWREIYG